MSCAVEELQSKGVLDLFTVVDNGTSFSYSRPCDNLKCCGTVTHIFHGFGDDSYEKLKHCGGVIFIPRSEKSLKLFPRHKLCEVCYDKCKDLI